MSLGNFPGYTHLHSYLRQPYEREREACTAKGWRVTLDTENALSELTPIDML